jgi:carboxypeptidase T
MVKGSLFAFITAACLLTILPLFSQTVLVEVPLKAPGDLQRLAALKFDVAGVDRARKMAGVVATPEELDRLAAERFSYEIRETSHPLRGRGEALSDYSDPSEIMAFVDRTVSEHPAIAKKIVLKDQLFEGQKQVAVLITSGVQTPNDRPSFIFDAQHHAREVMGPEIAMDAIEYLTSRYGTDADVTRWLNNINVYVVPSVNPDGGMYVFTQDNMWRKNRNPECGSGLKTGIDINRNYRFNWYGCYGSDENCSSLVYHGTSPDSEPETRGLESLMDEARALFAITLHAYGEYIIYPYGCTSYGQVSDEQDLFQAEGEKIVAVLENDDGQTNSFELSSSDGTDGMAQDTYYGDYGTYAYLIEVGRSFQPDFASMRDATVTRLRKAWQTLLDETLSAPQINGKITDSATGEPIPATITLAELPLSNGEIPRRANSRGHYNILARKNSSFHATFSLPGYCSQEKEAAVGENPVTMDVALIPSAAGLPGSPRPSSGAVNIPLTATLTWNWDVVGSCDVYFGILPDPPKTAAVTGNSWTTGPLETGKTYYWKVAKESPCGASTGPVWSFSTTPYNISSVAKKGDPFRLVVTGNGFSDACLVKINGTVAPATLHKGNTKLVARGGSALKALVPKGSVVTITVEDPSGGISNEFSFQW